MSIKRSSTAKSAYPRGGEDLSDKLDRQDFWDELQRRADSKEPFLAQDVAQAIGAAEAAVAKRLATLAFERLVEKVEGGRFRADPLLGVSQAEFVKALNARIDPKRQQDQLEIERLRKNNDEMRRRLLEAVAERDRYLAILRQHGIDPAEPA